MEDPAVLLVVKNELARKRAMQAFMEFGGATGTGWKFRRVYCGGLYVADYKDELRPPFIMTLLWYMQERRKPYCVEGHDWILSGWRKPLNAAQLEGFNAWRQACHDMGMPAHHPTSFSPATHCRALDLPASS